MERLQTISRARLRILLAIASATTIIVAIASLTVGSPWRFVLIPVMLVCVTAVGALLDVLFGKADDHEDTEP